MDMNTLETSEADDRPLKQRIFKLHMVLCVLLFATNSIFVAQTGKRFFDDILNDSFCDQQITTELHCTNVTISDRLQYWSSPFIFNKSMNFTVVFKNPSAKIVNVEKYPMENNDQVYVHGSDVIWKGSFDVSEANEIPKTIFSFHYKTRLEQCDDFYYINCPTLNNIIKESEQEWKNNIEKNGGVIVLALFALLIGFGALVGYLISKCYKH